jgi:hypothetical protein
MIRLALSLGLSLWAATAAAEPCANIADPLAYNACLARQGPTARAARVGPAPASRPARRPAAPVVTRRGRSEMVFTPRR